jgi:anti-anti-sigma factor
MNVTLKDNRGFTVVAPTGRLDAATAPEFEQRVNACIDQGARRVVFDFGDLAYISSAGLRSILGAAKKLKACGGSLSLCRLAGVVKEVIVLSGFDAFLSIHETVEQATQPKAGA